ncbi:hypothetical protein RMS29_001825 [Agrobacterium rosae]|uniref:Uncharacterized protein n=1 Tax=Agrobacterium rosae TaxID=1972867 RepID=A0ABU4VVY0_9HYPH|nr:hypothetical protein [Agrobacterium rosae]MDX8329658.1 hypothetical protein [Agrobacterium rosae]
MMDTNQRHPNAQTGGRAKSLKSLDLPHPRPPHSEIFFLRDYFYRQPMKKTVSDRSKNLSHCNYCILSGEQVPND